MVVNQKAVFTLLGTLSIAAFQGIKILLLVSIASVNTMLKRLFHINRYELKNKQANKNKKQRKQNLSKCKL